MCNRGVQREQFGGGRSRLRQRKGPGLCGIGAGLPEQCSLFPASLSRVREKQGSPRGKAESPLLGLIVPRRECRGCADTSILARFTGSAPTLPSPPTPPPRPPRPHPILAGSRGPAPSPPPAAAPPARPASPSSSSSLPSSRAHSLSFCARRCAHACPTLPRPARLGLAPASPQADGPARSPAPHPGLGPAERSAGPCASRASSGSEPRRAARPAPPHPPGEYAPPGPRGRGAPGAGCGSPAPRGREEFEPARGHSGARADWVTAAWDPFPEPGFRGKLFLSLPKREQTGRSSYPESFQFTLCAQAEVAPHPQHPLSHGFSHDYPHQAQEVRGLALLKVAGFAGSGCVKESQGRLAEPKGGGC